MRSASLKSTSLLLALVVTGCPEPPPDVVNASQGPTTTSGGGGDVASPDDPANAGGRIPPGMRIEPPGFGLEDGEGVKISGTIAFEGDLDGQLRVEILQSGGEGAGPQLLHALTLEELGPWSVVAPKGLGEVNLVAYLDRDQNGPSPDEPMALLEDTVDVGEVDIPGIELLLVAEPDPDLGKEPRPTEGEGAVATDAVEGEAAPAEGEAAPAEGEVSPADVFPGPHPAKAEDGPPPAKPEDGPPPAKPEDAGTQ